MYYDRVRAEKRKRWLKMFATFYVMTTAAATLSPLSPPEIKEKRSSNTDNPLTQRLF